MLRDTGLFILITVGIHVLWKIWQVRFEYAPVQDFMYGLMGLMSAEVYRESVWLIDKMYEMTAVVETQYMYFTNQSAMYINNSCSGLKQMLQFALLMMIYPGPWLKKLWFIPLGLVIMHLTNLFRVVGLAVVMNNWPWHWDFSHDYLFRPFFYVVIFMLWVWWVEKLKHKPPINPKTK